MMNRIALASLSLLMSLGVFAQEGAKWKMGVKVGWNYGDQFASRLPEDPFFSLNNLYNQSTDWLSGLNAGLSSNLNLSEKIALKVDLVYNQKGFRGSDVDTVLQDAHYVNRLHYLSLPLYAGVRLSPKFQLDLGAEASYLLGFTGTYNGEKIENLDKGLFKEMDFGLLGGITYQLDQWLQVQGRYCWGLRSIYDITFTGVSGETIDPQPKFINHGVQVSLTVFPF